MSNLGVDAGPAAGTGRGVLVGDGPQDVGAAWNAGLDGIHVERHGHDRRGSCVLGDRRVTRLTEIPRVATDGGSASD
jgi:phosphoglycolate phosphatase